MRLFSHIFLNSFFKLKSVALKNRLRVRWVRSYRRDQHQLQKTWKPSNSLKHPLTIPLREQFKLEFPINCELSNRSNVNQFNPAIALHGQSILVSWRIGDNFTHPKANSLGETLYASTGDLDGIGIGEINVDAIFVDPVISNCRILIDPDPDSERNSKWNQAIHDDVGFYTFEDPRFFPDDPDFLLVHVKYNQPKIQLNGTFSLVSVAILNCKTNDLIIPNASDPSIMEKNWVPIDSKSGKFRLLRSTEPLVMLQIDKETLETHEILLKSGVFSATHNGSNLLLIDKRFYVRVVRVRCNMEGLRGVRLSIIVVHDLDFKEISRTKPFIFRSFGFEICNSILEYQNRIIFSWGENDEHGYVGSIDKTDFVHFLEKEMDFGRID